MSQGLFKTLSSVLIVSIITLLQFSVEAHAGMSFPHKYMVSRIVVALTTTLSGKWD